MLALHTRGAVSGIASRTIFKVLELQEALTDAFPRDAVVVDLRAGGAVDREALCRVGIGGVLF